VSADNDMGNSKLSPHSIWIAQKEPRMFRNRTHRKVSRAAVALSLRLGLMLLTVLASFGANAPAHADWQWASPPNYVTLGTANRSNVFYVGDPVTFSIRDERYTGTTDASRYEVRDYYGTVVDQGPVAPGWSLTVHVSQPGWYKLYIHGAAQQAPWGDSLAGTMFVIFRRTANFPANPGLNLPSNGAVFDGDEVMRGVSGMGPQRHVVADASKPDEAIALLETSIAQDRQYYLPYDPARKRVLLVAFPNGTQNLDGVRKIVDHFKNDVKYWEARNEPNYSATGADFVNNELKPFYQTVKSVDPSLKVLGPGAVTIGPYGLGWTEDFLKAGGGNYIDAFSFHAYNNVNGDLALSRKSLDALTALLTKYGLGKVEKWQTEQGYMAACYGAYQPRLQGRWTMLQMMAFEQYGIPKEHNHLWYDRSHGFWSMPTWWMNEDGPYSMGSLNPAAPLMRVWSEELYGTNFAQAYDFGPTLNKAYLGSLFTGQGKQVAAFMSAGSTDGQVTLQVSGGTSLHLVSAFGVESDLPVIGGQAVLPVPELPVYVELAPSQTIQVVPTDWGPNLALAPGTTASASGTGTYPGDPTVPNDIGKIINGTLENWYWGQGKGDHPWMDNTPADHPAWVQITLPAPTLVNHVVIYAGVPWQNDGSLLDYELQYDNNGQWTTLSHVQEPANVVKAYTQTVHTTADSFYSDRNVFTHTFPEVLTQKLRLLVHDTTWGGGANADIVAAGGQTGPHQVELREVEVYHSGVSAPLVGTGLVGQYFAGTDLTTLKLTRLDHTINFIWNYRSPDVSLPAIHYSVRWTGKVQPQYSETYTFSAASHDGIRVWVNGQKLIDNWTDHPITADKGAIALEAGRLYDIKVEHYQNTGSARCQLLWSSASQGAQIVPAAHLFPLLPTVATIAGKVRYFPRTDCTSRMVGGRFQGSHDGVAYTDLGVITAEPPAGQWSELSLSADPKPYRFLRYLSPDGGYGNVSEVEFQSGGVKLSGTPFGTPGSYQNSGATMDKVFDGNTSTFFDAPTSSGNFAGIDQGLSASPK